MRLILALIWTGCGQDHMCIWCFLTDRDLFVGLRVVIYQSVLFVFFFVFLVFFFSSRRRHTRCSRDWSSDVCSSDLKQIATRRQDTAHPAHLLVVHQLGLVTPAAVAAVVEEVTNVW